MCERVKALLLSPFAVQQVESVILMKRLAYEPAELSTQHSSIVPEFARRSFRLRDLQLSCLHPINAGMGRNTRSSYKDEVQFVLQVDFGGSKVRILSAEKRFDSSEPPFNLVQRWPGEKDVRPYVPVVVAVEKQDEKTKFWGWEAEDMRRARPDDFVIYRNLKRALGPDEEIIDEEQLLENERDQDDYLYFSTRA